MKLKVLDALTAPGTAVNLDRWGFNPEAYWVIDGGSGRGGAPARPMSDTDAARAVMRLDETLAQAHFGERAFREVLAELPADLLDAATGPGSAPQLSVSAARIRDARLELIQQGGAPILWTSGSKVPDLSAFGPGAAAATPPRVRTQEVPAGAGTLVLLMSDGFHRLVDVFAKYNSAGLMRAAVAGGLRALYHELREAEALDPRGERHPRVGVRDDATAVLLEVA